MIVKVTFNDDEGKHIEEVCKKRGITKSEYVREMYFEGKKIYSANENLEFIIELLDQRLGEILKPNVERLAAISVKGAIMSASSTFLNAQALQDLVPKDKKMLVKEAYERARLKGIEYVKSKATDFNNEDI